jgi:hypothetical protein
MIEKLTTKQEVQLETHKAEWLNYGRSTEPMDKKTAVAALKYFYQRLGKKTPYFWFCDSPFQANLLLNILNDGKLGDNLRANLRDNLGDNLWDNLRANLWDNLRAKPWDRDWETQNQK